MDINYYIVNDSFYLVYGGGRVPFDTNYFNSHVILLDGLFVLDTVYYDIFKGCLYPFVLNNDTLLGQLPYPVSYYYKLHKELSGLIFLTVQAGNSKV